MPEITSLSPSAPVTVATTTPNQGEPILAKGFNDPAFLESMEKAFADRAAEAAKPAAEETTTEEPAPKTDPQVPPPKPPGDKKVIAPPADTRPPTPRKASEWAAFHDAKVKVEQERDELKAKLESFNGFDPKEYETTKTSNKTLQEKLDALALERSDKFQSYFNDQRDNISARIKSALGDKADKAIKLLDLPDSDWRTDQLESLSEELTPLRRTKLELAVSDMDKLSLERNKIVEKSAENWKKLQEVEKSEQSRKSAQLNEIFESEMKDLSDSSKGVAPFQKIEGNEEWNGTIKSRIELAKAIYSGEVPPQERARHAAWAATIPILLQNVEAGIKENQQLRSELEKLRGAETGLEQGQSTESSPEEYKGLSYGEALAKMIEKAGGFAGR